MEEYEKWQTQKKSVFVKNNEVIQMEDSQKKTKNREWKEEEERKNKETEKKKEDPPKKRSKKDILSNAEEVKKKKEIQELKTKEMWNTKKIKNMFENPKVLKESQKMMSRFKNEGFFFWFKKLKNKKLEMQKATTKVFFL